MCGLSTLSWETGEDRGRKISPETICEITEDLLAGSLVFSSGWRYRDPSSSGTVGNRIQRMTADQSVPLPQGAPHWLTSVYHLFHIHRCPHASTSQLLMRVHEFQLHTVASWTTASASHLTYRKHTIDVQQELSFEQNFPDPKWIHILSHFISRMASSASWKKMETLTSHLSLSHPPSYTFTILLSAPRFCQHQQEFA